MLIMTTSDAMRARVRLELGDLTSPFQASAYSDGTLTVLELPEKPVDPNSLLVWTSDGATVTALISNTDYTLDAENGFLTIPNPVPNGTYVNARGYSFRFFADSEIDTFVNTALLQHAHNMTDEFGVPITLANLPQVEEYPLALLALTEALWALATDGSYDISISTPEGISIPRGQRQQQLMAMIQARQQQYAGLCEALNVGLFRIEMFDLRRESYKTGRLVPIYRPREIEDTRPATRVFPHIDELGATPAAVPAITRLDLLSVARQAFSVTITLGVNVSNANVYAFVRAYPDVFGYLAKFTVVVNDAPSGNVTISLTPEQTWYLRPKSFWDIGTVDNTSGAQVTLQQGEFTTVRQGGAP
jgi:hypothetical protein